VRDHLPDALRRCVDQAIAAETLEGWRPTGGHVAALDALVRGEVTFEDYLAPHLARCPAGPSPDTPRRMFRRRVPYLIPGTTLLRNNFGADTHEMLAELEFVSSAARIAGWHQRLADGDVGVDDLDFRAVHRTVFGDVYSWAGRYRVTDLRLGDHEFAPRSSVPRLMGRVDIFARALVSDHGDRGREHLADQLARLYADYNLIHPFREGNGRTGTLVLHSVAALRGHRLDLGAFSRKEWYAASRASMPSAAQRRADHRPFVPLLERALG